MNEHAWLRRMADAEDAAGGSISVGGFAVDAGLYPEPVQDAEQKPGDAELMRDMGAAMERVRGCDEKKGDDGLCDCARFIGAIIRERTRHVPVMRAVIEEQEAALAALRAPAGAQSPESEGEP